MFYLGLGRLNRCRKVMAGDFFGWPPCGNCEGYGIKQSLKPATAGA